MNLPGCEIEIPTLTEKDIFDIKGFGLKHRYNVVIQRLI